MKIKPFRLTIQTQIIFNFQLTEACGDDGKLQSIIPVGNSSIKIGWRQPLNS
jgi:hypothetical protein